MTEKDAEVRVHQAMRRPVADDVDFIEQEADKAPQRGTCLKCGEGFIVDRTGKHGHFFSCSRWPLCDGKPDPREYGYGDEDPDDHFLDPYGGFW